MTREGFVPGLQNEAEQHTAHPTRIQDWERRDTFSCKCVSRVDAHSPCPEDPLPAI